jgi:Pro-kumamolisin, activation domain/Bacterial Ig-like domain (group 3)
MGGFMKNRSFNLRRNLVPAASSKWALVKSALLASLCACMFAGSAFAQTAAAPRIPARVTQIVDEGNLTTLRGNVHRLARPEFDRGAVADSQPANRMIILLKRSPEQETALRQLLDQQQDKSSANYHAWLTPDRFGKQFGPADSDIQAVTDWLTSRGFTDIKVGAGRTTVEFSGNIGQVRNAFHTEIHHFLVGGKAHMASVSDPQIPAALAPVIAGVLPLHDFRPKSHAHSLGTFRRTKATGEVKPLFTFNGCGSNGSPCYAVGPGDFAKIYNVPSGLDGSGVTIAIVEDSNLNVADVQAYRTMFGLSNNFTSSNIILNGPDPGIQGPNSASDDEIEADLDAQLSGGVAPGATINVVVSEDSQSIGIAGIDLSAIYIIDNNFAPILSESFGACEPHLTAPGAQFYDALWQQASAQGITVILSSGDSGSDSCDQGTGDFGTTGLSVSGLASTPFNIAIGGTDFQNGANPSPFWNAASSTTTSAKGYVPESTWNDSCASTAAVGNLGTCTAAIVNGNAGNSNTNGIDLAAGGGGPSTITSSGTTLVNPKPAWQSGTAGDPSDGARDVPDLSFFAGDGFNGSFYIICQMDQNAAFGGSSSSCDLNSPFHDFQGVGGTSAGAPAFAGIMALINQKTGQRQGNPNYVLYQLYKKNTAGTICPSAASPASTCIFYDTTSGNISVACKGGTPNCSNTSTAANQYGVFVADPTKPTTTAPAWTAGTGYDLATGLGSVNVANLITAWGTASFTADTVAITNPTTAQTIAHGASQSFTVKVTSGSGTPTGQVALVATPSTGSPVTIGGFSDNGPFTLSGGTVTFSTSELPGGTSYPVVASYGGDGTFAAGKSPAVTFTVTPENSKTVVSLVTEDSNGNVVNSNAITAAYGSPYILEIAVEDNAGNQCAKVTVTCPTGTVTLTDNGAPLKDFSGSNSVKLNSEGIAEDQPVQLAGGPHSLAASYGGDNSYNASVSAANAITISPAATTISVTPSTTSVNSGQSFTLTATIGTQSAGVGPTGTVTFSAGGTVLGSGAVPVTPANASSSATASATATLQTSFSTGGAKSITATYTTGDANYSGSGPSTPVTVTVTGSQATTTALTANTTSIASGGSVTLTAKVTGTTNMAGPTGTVQFMNGNTALGTAATCASTAGTTNTQGTCTATLTTTSLTTPGPNSITGMYSGDPIYSPSTSVALVVTVTSAPQATSTVVTPSATSIASGGSVTLTAKATGTTNNGAGPTGTVQFMNGTSALGTAATCMPTAGTSTTPGTCTATLMTTLSMLTPLAPPRATPNWPATPMWIVATLLLAVFLLILRRLPRSQRLGYGSAGLLLFACLAAGIAGCGGGSSSSTPMSHTDSITAVYSGDTAYSGSTSAAVSITIQ